MAFFVPRIFRTPPGYVRLNSSLERGSYSSIHSHTDNHDPSIGLTVVVADGVLGVVVRVDAEQPRLLCKRVDSTMCYCVIL